MIKVGITGQTGFIGTHLFNYLSLQKKSVLLLPFEKEFFKNTDQLEHVISKCDVLIHLAAINRADKESDIFNANISLVKKIIAACKHTNSKPKIIFASSIQETLKTAYGSSKKEGFQLLKVWAKNVNATVDNLIIPNVFGPDSKPYYNSVVATFCSQLVEQKPLHVLENKALKLIYCQVLVEIIYERILANEKGILSKKLVPTYTISVSEIKDILTSFHNSYQEKNTIPNLTNPFHYQLFATYMSFVPATNYPKTLKRIDDARGSFSEIIKTNSTAQFSYSITKPGITRGNHLHTRKIERFVVLKGTAIVKLRKLNTNTIIEYKLDGNNPSYIDIPLWYTHNITNTGDENLITLFWINEHYDSSDSDTFTEVV